MSREKNFVGLAAEILLDLLMQLVLEYEYGNFTRVASSRKHHAQTQLSTILVEPKLGIVCFVSRNIYS